jgi:glutathione S-transferase
MTAVLWHIPVSHYNEKVRWALDLKGVEHERRAPPPPTVIPIALWLTRGAGATFPVLVIDGEAIGDSTAIIAALEERFPDPPLYPADPAERRRALAIEDWFDTELGPSSRLLVFHEMRESPDAFEDFAAPMLPGSLRRSATGRRLAGRLARAFVQLRYRVAPEDAAAAARADVVAALDRLEAELAVGDGTHLVGDRFSVADLTAAALFAPIVDPPEGPEIDVGLPPSFERFRQSIADRPGYRWVAETFARERGTPRRP